MLLLDQHRIGESTCVRIIPTDFDSSAIDGDDHSSTGNMTSLLRRLDDTHTLFEHINLLCLHSRA